MSSARTLGKDHRQILSLLQESGLPYDIQWCKKHIRFILAGKPVCVMSRGRKQTGGLRGINNVLADTRRAIREEIERAR